MFEYYNGRISFKMREAGEISGELAQVIALVKMADLLEDVRDSLVRLEEVISMVPDNLVRELKDASDFGDKT